MSLDDLERLVSFNIVHLVAFWIGLRLLKLAIDLGKQDVPAPYTIAIADFKRARQIRDLISLGLGAVGALVCLITTVSIAHFFW